MPSYPVGPGHTRSHGAVVQAYADTDALERDCPPTTTGCGVKAGEFCVFENGEEKHIPCIVRTKARRAVS